jgi:uncharacterized RDD family membrane protein YckC
MRMADWYYVDAAGQRVGPVAAEEVRAAVARGAATMASLAWRDGLGNWMPISQVAAELGLPGAAPTVVAPMPPQHESLEANPYRVPDSESSEARFDTSGEVVYAGFWRRWAALFLDQIIIGLPLSVVFFFLSLALGLAGGFGKSDPNPVGVIVMQLVFYMVWFAVALVYYAGLESSEAQATFGKRALGIKVTDLDGKRITFKHAAGRWFAAALSYMSLYIGYAMAGFTQRKQALHDIVAGTLVVDRWAFTPEWDRQQRGMGGCLILFIVMMSAFLIMIPIAIVIAVASLQEFNRHNVGGYVEPPARMVCEAPPSSTYVARCLPVAFDA